MADEGKAHEGKLEREGKAHEGKVEQPAEEYWEARDGNESTLPSGVRQGSSRGP